MNQLSSLSVLELVNKANVSVRLRNAFNQAAKEGDMPFITLGDFLESGEAGRNRLLSMKKIGRLTAEEFITLVNTLTKDYQITQDLSNHESLSPNEDLKHGNDIIALFIVGFSTETIANRYNVAESTVINIINRDSKYNIPIMPNQSEKKVKMLARSIEFLELYKKGLTYQSIGDKYGISRERVRQILDRYPAFHEYIKRYQTAREMAEQDKKLEAIRKLQKNSIATRYPSQIAEFWDFEKNGDLKPEAVASRTGLVDIWLKCPKDGYSWIKKPKEITRLSWDKGARGCPICAGKSGKKPVKQPFLMDVYPEFVNQYWDYSKNDALGFDPKCLTLASNRKIWLKCPHDGYAWEARVGMTMIEYWSKGKSGCRLCRRKAGHSEKPSG